MAARTEMISRVSIKSLTWKAYLDVTQVIALLEYLYVSDAHCVLVIIFKLVSFQGIIVRIIGK